VTRRSHELRVLALAAALAAVLAPPAAAHEPAARAGGSAPQVRADPGEVAALGRAHAEEHARERARARIERARWNRLTPSQRARRIAAARRQTAVLNRALAQRARDDVGYWEPSLIALPEYAIHASMLPTGKILMFGRQPLVGGTRSNRGSAILFDPATGLSKHLPPPPIPENPDGQGGELPAAIFCSGQALLSDGRVLLAGGNRADPAPDAGRPQYAGLDYTFIFDPWTETWSLGPRMSHGRWYPTLTKLSSGDVIIASGLEEDGQGTVNPGLEIYHPGAAAATPLAPVAAGERGPAIGTGIQLSLYPGLFLLPDGNVALAGPGKQDSALLDTTALAAPGAGRGGAWTQIPATEPSQQHYGGSPVLEPRMDAFSGSWNILVTGGADSNGGVGFFPARSTVDRLGAGPGEPVWSHDPQDDQRQARFYPNDVLLPDGAIAAIGGGLAGDYSGPATDGNYYVGAPPPPQLKQVELRRPGERAWRLGAAQQEYRTYHSTAALLPDGRILSAGDDGHEGPLDAPIPPDVRRDSAEIYWPPYLFDGDECALRPVIRGVGGPSAPADAGAPWATLTYGERFGIFSEHAQPGMQAVLVAPAAVTHGVDMNQRVVALQVASTVPAGGVNALTPPHAAIAPPGYYMLFVVDAAGTPSVARWVRLLAPADAAAARGGATPADVTAPWPDAKGRSCTQTGGTVRSEPDPGALAPPPAPAAPSGSALRRGAKLVLRRAAIVRGDRKLDVLAGISALATGRVTFDLLAAGRRTRLTAPIDHAHRRVRLRRTIPAAQARLGTGILTISYRGNGRTRPLSVRVRAARNPARLAAARPSYAAGRLRASGTIATRARGVVHVRLQFDHDGRTRTEQFDAAIAKGRWTLSARPPAGVRAAIAGRSGTLDADVLYTGDRARRLRGELRSYEVLGDP
jgi:hypothetical protein